MRRTHERNLPADLRPKSEESFCVFHIPLVQHQCTNWTTDSRFDVFIEKQGNTLTLVWPFSRGLHLWPSWTQRKKFFLQAHFWSDWKVSGQKQQLNTVVSSGGSGNTGCRHRSCICPGSNGGAAAAAAAVAVVVVAVVVVVVVVVIASVVVGTS